MDGEKVAPNFKNQESHMKTRIAWIALALVAFAGTALAADDLAAGFAKPPDEAKPRTWWHWVTGNVTKEGITADLEAMKHIGLGGAQMFHVNQGPQGPVKYMSPEWHALVHHAIAESKRLGLELAIHDCEGWSESGGPWVKPEQSMQKVVWTETRVRGGQKVAVNLPQPQTVRDCYRDIAVLAFPTLAGEEQSMAEMKPKVTASAPDFDGAKIIDGDPGTAATLPLPTKEHPQFIQFEFADKHTFGSVWVGVQGIYWTSHWLLQAGDDGQTFRPVCEVSSRANGFTSFAPVTARFFKIIVPEIDPQATKLVLTDILFGAARIDRMEARTGMTQDADCSAFTAAAVGPEMTIRRETIVDLADHMDKTGRLEWDAPAGNWTVLRIGHTPTGQCNGPSTAEGCGLECDKMSAAAVEAHFNGMMAKVIAEAGPLAGQGATGLTHMLCDSWEAGCQNWTPLFPEEFRKRHGYDLHPWLPALSGRIVGSVELTQRFLWDFRRTIGDLIAQNHYGLLRKLCNEHGMKYYAEACGPGTPTIADNLQCKGAVDVPMGEFWIGGGGEDVREAASGAHIYGRRYAAAESFTSVPEMASWRNDPYGIKALGDSMFCEGLNRMVFHRYAAQPDDRKPGVTMGPWGLNFERTQTWWEPGAAWVSYLARCQHLLAQGLFVADACYYYGEGVPRNLDGGCLRPGVPAGYDYDGCNTEVLMTRMTVKDGRIVLPDGMSYRVLVLPDSDRLTPPALGKVAELVRAGATVVGPRPAKSPSMSDYPNCDADVEKIAGELWGPIEKRGMGVPPMSTTGVPPMSSPSSSGNNEEKKHGQDARDTHGQDAHATGRVTPAKSMADVFAALGVKPDFGFTDVPRAKLLYIHRRDADTDIYFVSNQKADYTETDCTFRVSGKQPELWHPDSGLIEAAPLWHEKDGRTTVRVRFDPFGSVFVVFRGQPTQADPFVSVTVAEKNKAAAKHTLEIRKAVYGQLDQAPAKTVDVTAKLVAMVREGKLVVQADNDIAGDPAPLVIKQMRVEYVYDGRPLAIVVHEKEYVDIGQIEPPQYELAVSADGKCVLTASGAGTFTLTTASGKTRTAEVPSVADAAEIADPWELRFPPKWGAPESVTLERLISWSQHKDDGVKYFSGTATYVKEFDVPAEMIGEGKTLYLDLGMVKNLAEVSLNGQNLGVLWKPPFRVEISGVAKAGKNRLEIKVTNLWPNRLIGDQKLPEKDRFTWTTFNPYKADSPLLDSGLLGPVMLRPAVRVEVK